MAAFYLWEWRMTQEIGFKEWEVSKIVIIQAICAFNGGHLETDALYKRG